MIWSFQYRCPLTEDGWRTSTRQWDQAEHAAAAVAQMQAICALTGVIMECRLHEAPSTGSGQALPPEGVRYTKPVDLTPEPDQPAQQEEEPDNPEDQGPWVNR